MPRSLSRLPSISSRSLSRLAVPALLAAALTGCGSGGALSVSTQPAKLNTSEIRLPGGALGVWGNPTSGLAPKGLLLLIHGGSWKGIDPAEFNSTLATAPIFQRLGFETLTVEYRRGAQGLSDVLELYALARARAGARLPICAVGVSAGGHIGLMLAVRIPQLACVIDLAGPTDLPALKTEPHGALSPYKIAVRAFGTGALTALSPALHASSIRAKVLLLYAQNDPLVPVGQGEVMERADPRAKLIVLPPGSAPFVHTGVGAPPQTTGVDASAYNKAVSEEVQFLDAVAAGS